MERSAATGSAGKNSGPVPKIFGEIKLTESIMSRRFKDTKSTRKLQRFIRTDSIEILEKELQSQVEQLLRLYTWRYYHTWDSRNSVEGFPDLLALRGERRMVSELKKQGEDPTLEQWQWLHHFAQIGFETYIWRPVDIEQISKVLR